MWSKALLPHLATSLFSEPALGAALSVVAQVGVFGLRLGSCLETELPCVEVGADAVCSVGTQEARLRERQADGKHRSLAVTHLCLQFCFLYFAVTCGQLRAKIIQ